MLYVSIFNVTKKLFNLQCLGGGGGHSSGGKDGIWCWRKNFARFGTQLHDFLLKKFQDEAGWDPKAAEQFWERWPSKEVYDLGKKFWSDYEAHKAAEKLSIGLVRKRRAGGKSLRACRGGGEGQVPCQNDGLDAAKKRPWLAGGSCWRTLKTTPGRLPPTATWSI